MSIELYQSIDEQYRYCLCDKYKKLKEQEATLKKELEDAKNDLLEEYGGAFEDHGLECKLVHRKGSLDAARLQITHGWSEGYLDNFRKKGGEAWTITKAKGWA